MGIDVVQKLPAVEHFRLGRINAAALPDVAEPAAAKFNRSTADCSGSSRPEALERSASEPAKRAYPAPAETPTQVGPNGFRFDFNDGCRVLLPESEAPWRARMSDLDTGNILFETELKAGRLNSTKR